MSVQMLGGAFSHEDFDETTWINETLAQKDDDATLEAHISAVFTKLQILAADLNDDLERGMNEVVNALPRAIGEAAAQGTARALNSAAERGQKTNVPAVAALVARARAAD